jgi:hypothetical protein
MQFTAITAVLAALAFSSGVEANTNSSCKVKAPIPMRAVTVLKSEVGYNVTGTIEFYQAKEGAPVSVVGTVKGLTPNSEKGFHVQ